MTKFILFIFTFLFVSFLNAQTSFNPNSLIVLRVGDGSANLSGASAPVFLDEYSTTGTLVQSISIPYSNAAPHKLVLTGNSINQGFITLSSNKQYVVFAGYDTTIGGMSPSSSATINKSIAFVDYAGNIDLSTSIKVEVGAIRTAASDDGVNVWFGGGNKGVYYATKGDTGKVLIEDTITNSKCLMIYGPQLYLSTAQGSNTRVGKVGEGLCTTGLQPFKGFLGLPTIGSPNQFFLADLNPAVPGFDVLYVTDNVASSIQKFSYVNNSWIDNGSVSVSLTGAAGSGLKGLTGSVNGTDVTLYTNSASTLYSLIDSKGYNSTLTATFATIASADVGKAFNSLCFAPIAPLPVGLISFNGNIENKTTNLWWTIESQQDVKQYEIEYSLNAKTFALLKTVAVNNSNQYQYKSTDQLGETVFYRLKITDKNGSVTYSKIITLQTNASNHLSVYPNPAKDYFVVSQKDLKQVEVMNEIGKIVYKTEAINNSAIYISTKAFTKGIYVIKTINKQNVATLSKVVVE